MTTDSYLDERAGTDASGEGAPALPGDAGVESVAFSDARSILVDVPRALRGLLDEVGVAGRCFELLGQEARCAGCPHDNGNPRRRVAVRQRTLGCAVRLEICCCPPVTLAGAEGRCVPIIVRDATHRAARDAALERRTREAATLTELVLSLRQPLDPVTVAEKVLSSVRILVPEAVGQVWEYDADRDLLVCMAGGEDLSAERGPSRELRMEEGLAGLAAARREPVLSDDAQADPGVVSQGGAAEARTRACLAQPFFQRGQLGGVLLVCRRGSERFSREELQLIEAFATHAAIALENARLYAALQSHAAELESRVLERTRALEKTNRQLTAASRHKSEFLANMSHELRTPLTCILGFGQLLLRRGKESLSAQQQHYARTMLESSEHLLQLINDILDLSKAEAGRITLAPEAVDVHALLEGLTAVARGLGHSKSLVIRLQADPALPLVVADPVRLKQICYNLLSNAVKFTRPGGTIAVRARGIGPLPEAPGPWIEIAVTDTGIGISPEDLSRLFMPFTQLEPAGTKCYEGTGLGLALTRRLVDLHGGSVTGASPGEGQGSTFTVVLPAGGPEAGRGIRHAAEAAGVGHRR